MGEVERKTGLLIRDSVHPIDDWTEEESPYLNLSNFLVREDSRNGELLLYMSRPFANDFRTGEKIDWTADAYEYRIAVE